MVISKQQLRARQEAGAYLKLSKFGEFFDAHFPGFEKGHILFNKSGINFHLLDTLC